jgi:hypothetical protein
LILANARLRLPEPKCWTARERIEKTIELPVLMFADPSRERMEKTIELPVPMFADPSGRMMTFEEMMARPV